MLAVIEGSIVDELASVSGAIKALVTRVMADDVVISVGKVAIVDALAAAEVGFDSSKLLVVEKLIPEHIVGIYRINRNIKICWYMQNCMYLDIKLSRKRKDICNKKEMCFFPLRKVKTSQV